MASRFSTSLPARRERARIVYDRLRKAYPDARCSLDFETPLQLLVATILAAQCTDARVNIVTKPLFKKFGKPEDYIAAPRATLEEAVRTCGFYRQKAKSIVKACTRIRDVYGGEVPGTMEDLLTLDGVGRKTANVILGECFGTQGIIVDTHGIRINNRLGYVKTDDPVKIERELMRVWPEGSWTLFSHCLVFHGRAVCKARGPLCGECTLYDQCPHGAKVLKRGQ